MTGKQDKLRIAIIDQMNLVGTTAEESAEVLEHLLENYNKTKS